MAPQPTTPTTHIPLPRVTSPDEIRERFLSFKTRYAWVCGIIKRLYNEALASINCEPGRDRSDFAQLFKDIVNIPDDLGCPEDVHVFDNSQDELFFKIYRFHLVCKLLGHEQIIKLFRPHQDRMRCVRNKVIKEIYSANTTEVMVYLSIHPDVPHRIITNYHPSLYTTLSIIESPQ